MVKHMYNPSTEEMERGGSRVPSQSKLQRATLSQKNKTEQKCQFKQAISKFSKTKRPDYRKNQMLLLYVGDF
jgi:hypothetical protein